MNSKGATSRRPVWVAVTIGAFVLLVVVGLFVIAVRDLPTAADPEVVEETFAEQIAFLKELALSCPEPTKPPSFDSDDDAQVEAWREFNLVWEEWSKKSESRPDLMSHPAIKGASVYIAASSGGIRARMILVDHDDLEPSWFESVWTCLHDEGTEPEGDPPEVRQWRDGDGRLVRYEAYFVGPDGANMGLQLLVDLNLVNQNAVDDDQNAVDDNQNAVDDNQNAVDDESGH